MATALLAAAAWLGWVEWSHGAGRPLPWEDLTARTLAEPLRPELRVFRSRDALRRHLRAGGTSATVPTLDFTRFDAVLVTAGPRSSSAYELEVLGVTEQRRRVVVAVRERSPSLARPGTTRLVFPFRLIAIERTGKTVALEWRGRP